MEFVNQVCWFLLISSLFFRSSTNRFYHVHDISDFFFLFLVSFSFETILTISSKTSYSHIHTTCLVGVDTTSRNLSLSFLCLFFFSLFPVFLYPFRYPFFLRWSSWTSLSRENRRKIELLLALWIASAMLWILIVVLSSILLSPCSVSVSRGDIVEKYGIRFHSLFFFILFYFLVWGFGFYICMYIVVWNVL